MLGILRRRGILHIKHNKNIYSLFSAIFLLGGILGGVIAFSTFDDQIFADISVFFSVYSLFGVDNLSVFANAGLRNLQVLFLIFLCGFFPFTKPLIFGFVGIFGFQFGFAATFFTANYGGGGIVLTLLLVWMPKLLFLTVLFHFSRIAFYASKRKLYISYTRDFMFSSSLTIICGIFEAFVFPVVLRVAAGLFL